MNDFFDAEHLEFVSADVAPTQVDTTNGIIYRDRSDANGMLANNASATINLTMKIKDDVQPGTQIQNAVEHKLNISNTCTCGEDPNPDNNTNDELPDIIHDLALIKTLNPNNSPYKPGDDVTFEIYIENQGEAASSGLVITDYIPTGLTLNDPDWIAS